MINLDSFSNKDEILKANKTKFSDCIVYWCDKNNEIQVLLLKRAGDDVNMPNKWALPGGHVDNGEDFLVAAKRELYEETGIIDNYDISLYKTVNKKDCIISYYKVYIKDKNFIYLDEEEHHNYEWVNIKELNEYETIFDIDIIIKECFNII